MVRAVGIMKFAIMASGLAGVLVLFMALENGGGSADEIATAEQPGSSGTGSNEDFGAELSRMDPLAALAWGMADGDTKIIQGALERVGCLPACTELFEDLSPLHRAAADGHADVVRLFLDAGADINQRAEPNGWTPLIQALRSSQVDIARLLVAEGADTSIVGTDGVDAALLADMIGVSDLIPQPPLKLAPQDADLLLLYAIEAGDLGIVRQTIDAGASPEATSPTNGWSALMIASFNGRTDIVRYLVDSISEEGLGYAEPGGGFNALHAALIGLPDAESLSTLSEILGVLTTAGLNPRWRTQNGHSAIEVAMSQKAPEEILTLLGDAADDLDVSFIRIRTVEPIGDSIEANDGSDAEPSAGAIGTYVATTDINLRDRPSATSGIILVVPKGQAVFSEHEWRPGIWMFVTVSGQGGFLKSDFISRVRL